MQFDVDSVIDLLDLVREHNKDAGPEELLNLYVSTLKANSHKWMAVFPLSYNWVFSRSSFRGSHAFGYFRLSSPRSSYRNFANFTSKYFGMPPLNRDLYEHQKRTTGGFFQSLPTLTFAIKGTYDSARTNSYKYFSHFMKMQDLFIALGKLTWSYRSSTEDNPHHFMLIKLNNGDINRFPFWEGIRINAKASNDLLAVFRKYDFAYYTNLVFSKINDRLYNRISKSLHFFSKGFNQPDNISKFIFYVIALESLFSKDKYTPLRTTLADYVALFCYKSEKRHEKHKLIKNIYDLRSAIVHTGQTNISSEIIEQAEEIASKAIYQSLSFHRHANKNNNDIEQLFFNHLLELKLQ